MVFHVLKIFDNFFVVTDSIYHMNFGEIFQPLTGELAALEAPGHFLLFRTVTKTVAAISTGGIHMVGKASVATDVFNRNLIGYSHFLQRIQILILIGQVFRASPTIKPADPNQLNPRIVHLITFL